MIATMLAVAILTVIIASVFVVWVVGLIAIGRWAL